jgi:hypothetical protein
VVHGQVVGHHRDSARRAQTVELKLSLQVRRGPPERHRRIAARVGKVEDRAVEHHLVVRHHARRVAVVRDLHVIPLVARPVLHCSAHMSTRASSQQSRSLTVAWNVRVLPRAIDRVVPRLGVSVTLRRVDDRVAIRNHLVQVHLEIGQVDNRVIKVDVVLVNKVCRVGVCCDVNREDLAARARVVHRKLACAAR